MKFTIIYTLVLHLRFAHVQQGTSVFAMCSNSHNLCSHERLLII
jgi:hypothetical protein